MIPITDPLNHTTTFDALNRRTGVTYADTSTTAYTYDTGNPLTQVVDSIAGNITRTHDGLNRLTSETTPQGSVSYTYDAAARAHMRAKKGRFHWPRDLLHRDRLALVDRDLTDFGWQVERCVDV